MYSKYLIIFVFFISSVPLLSQTPPAYISDSLQGILDRDDGIERGDRTIARLGQTGGAGLRTQEVS